jgi:predicted Zn-dependent peptidase
MRKLLVLLFFFAGALMSKSSLPPHYTTTLENGLEVVAIPLDNGSDVVSIDLFYKVGSRNEVMGKSGIAHMLEHLNFKSTKNMKAGEFDEIVKGYGGVNNASTGFDYTHYFIKASTRNLGKSLELFADMMENLALKDEEFQPERQVVAEERRWRTDNNPMGYLYFRLFNTTYTYHPYHWTPIGFMEDINTWSIEDIRAFHKTYYAPNNAILVVSGDFKKEKLFALSKEQFGAIKKGPPVPKVHMQEPNPDGAKRATVYKESEVEMLAITYHVPNFQHKDIIALNAISEILSSGKSSRLEKTLVDEKRLVNQVFAYTMDLIDPGVFMIVAVCNPGVEAEFVEKEIQAQLDQIKQGDVSKEELDKIKLNTKSDFIYSIESSSNVTNLFGSFLARGDLAPLLSYEADIDALELKTVQETAKRYFQSRNSTTVILKKELKTNENTYDAKDEQ